MNNLSCKILPEEVVVLKKSYYPNHQLFVCQNGFGMNQFSRNSTIYGYFVNGERAKIEGWEIDATETEHYQEINGKFLKVK